MSPSIAVIGPGAIGCAVAAGLCEGGHQPMLAARSASFDRLVVEHPNGVVEADLDVRLDPSGLLPVDVVFVAVKAHQSAAAKPWLDALVGAETAVAVLQNGVEHRDRIAPLVDPTAEVIPTIVNLPARRHGPGRVVVGGRARLTFEQTPSAEKVAGLFDGTFVSARPVDDWLTPAWTKLMLNAASGGVCTLTRSDNRLFLDDSARDLALRVMKEVAAVGRAEGAVLDEELPAQIIERLLQAAPGHMASIVVDRIAGQPTEWDARNAVVGRRAAAHGIEVPLNDLLTSLIRLGEPTD